MEVGEQWAYREKAHTVGWPVLPVEVLQLGPPRSQKVRIKFLAGEYPGLDQWVPKVRLRVPWSEAEDWLHDERRYAEAQDTSHEPTKTPARSAAWLACLAYPGPGNIYITYPDESAPIIEIRDLAAFAEAIELMPEELLAEPGAFVDRAGTCIAPWPLALRVARRVAEAFPEAILTKVREEERTLRQEAVHGQPFDYGHGFAGVVPAAVCAEWLREREPGFVLLREWCGAEPVSHFDEVQSLRDEVERLRGLVEEAARRLDEVGRPQLAGRIRRQLDAAMPEG